MAAVAAAAAYPVAAASNLACMMATACVVETVLSVVAGVVVGRSVAAKEIANGLALLPVPVVNRLDEILKVRLASVVKSK